MKEGWQVKKLGDICDLQNGYAFKSGDYIESSNTLNIRMSSIRPDGSFDSEHNQRFLPDTFAKAYESFLLKEDDLIIAMTDMAGDPKILGVPTLVANLNGRSFLMNQRVGKLFKFSESIQIPYLRYFLSSPSTKEFYKNKGAGGLQINISKGDVLSVDVPLPPLPEQQRIVAILDDAFESIAIAKANAEKNLQNARALFESYLQGVFSHGGEGWVEKSLSELCDIKHGFAFKSEFFTEHGDYVLLTPGNFYESGGYRDRGEKQKYYSGDIPEGFVLSKGDLLVAMTEQAAGLLGSPILVPESGKFLHNQRLGLVIPKPDVIWDNEFFFYVFNTQSFRKEIHNSATGLKVRHTSPTKIGEVLVSFPSSINEQKAIVSRLNDLDQETQRLESLYQQKITALDELKKALLHQAFSGQL